MTSTSTNWRRNSPSSPRRRRRADAPPREERIIAGFEEIQRFVEKHGRAPQHGEDRDIFERLYAVRLDRLRALRNAAPCLRRWTIRGCWPARRSSPPRPSKPMDDDELLAELGRRGGRGRHHRASPCPHQRRQARRRGDRQPQAVRGLRDVQAAVRAGADGARDAACARPGPFEARPPRDRAGRLLHPRRPDRLRRRGGRGVRRRPHGEVDRRLRVDLRQRHREQSAAALASARVLQRRRGAAAGHRPESGPAVFGGELRSGRRRERHDLCPAQQVRPSRMSRSTAT